MESVTKNLQLVAVRVKVYLYEVPHGPLFITNIVKVRMKPNPNATLFMTDTAHLIGDSSISIENSEPGTP